MPRHVCHRPQTHHLESGKTRELIQIGLRDERHDWRSLAQAHSIRKPEEPRKIPVVQGDDDPAAAADVRPKGLEQSLNVGRVIEISVQQNDVGRVRARRDLTEMLGRRDLFAPGVDRREQHPCVAG
jgi:hypothetical protein